jgi:hypothetical protein
LQGTFADDASQSSLMIVQSVAQTTTKTIGMFAARPNDQTPNIWTVENEGAKLTLPRTYKKRGHRFAESVPSSLLLQRNDLKIEYAKLLAT